MRRGRLCLLSACGFMLSATALHAQVPQLIRYQGTVVDASNVPLEGTYALTFRLYDTESGGTALWTETQTGLPISRGVFNVLLGQATPLTLAFDKDYWLSTQVGTDAEMSPRQRLTSVPYAYRSEMADQVQDQPPGFEVDTSGTLTEGLIAYWKLEEASGARDDQKGPHDLTDHSTVTSTPGKKGSAGQFTAANAEYLSIADNADLSIGANQSYTFAIWVYVDSAPSANRYIISKYDNADANKQEYRLVLGASPSGFGFGHRAGGDTFSWTSFNPSTGTWYLLVFWHDANAQTLYLQINDGNPYSVGMTSASMVDSVTDFVIGAFVSGGTRANFWDGRIDEVGFWKRVLTAQERAALYNAGVGNTYRLGKAASPWTQADAGIAYTEGRLGVGTLNIPNILSVQQGSPTDPIADSWTVYPSDRQHKQLLRTINPHGYLTQLKAVELYEWTRTPLVNDEEAKQALRSSRPAPEALAAKKRDLAQTKALLPKFTTKRVGLAIDDANVPTEVLTFNEDGSKAGIDLLAYLGYLHAALKEAALRIDELESRLPPGRSP